MAYLGEGTPKLGFGLMRLPNLEPGKPDIDQIKQMVDLFLERGFTYFDTARAYGASEAAIKEALVDRYPRDSYTLATKNAAWLGASSEAEAKAFFDISLETTGAGYFDYYLIHNLGSNRTKVFDDYGIWDFVQKKKKQGLVKHVGCSIHDKAAVVDQILTAHPEMEFVQLQINYLDWEDVIVQSHQCLEVCAKHGKPVVIMEPVKGGLLANPPEAVASILAEAEPSWSPSEWAIRFAASQPGIITVLSGMSTLAQMEENTRFMSAFEPLTSSQMAAIDSAREALMQIDSIPCTACEYCIKGCPMDIPIPAILNDLNSNTFYGNLEKAKGQYGFDVRGFGKASDCIECMQCEKACPQSINITEHLKNAVTLFE